MPVLGEGIVIDLPDAFQVSGPVLERKRPDRVSVPARPSGGGAEAAFEVLSDVVDLHRLEASRDPKSGLFEEFVVVRGVIGLEKARRRPESVDLKAELGIMMGIERPFEHLDASGPAIALGLAEEAQDGFLVVLRFKKAEEGRPDAEGHLMGAVDDDRRPGDGSPVSIAHEQTERCVRKVRVALRIEHPPNLADDRGHPKRIAAIDHERQPKKLIELFSLRDGGSGIRHGPSLFQPARRHSCHR